MYEELDIVEEMSTTAAREFQEYYDEFCQKKDIDIEQLNKNHAERIKHLYSDADAETSAGKIPYSGSTGIVPFDEQSVASDPKDALHTEENAFESDSPIPGDDREMHDIFSKLFKKLAIQLHPDKINTMDLTDEQQADMLKMFTTARSALDERRYFILIDYAEKLKIPLPKNYRQQIRWMKRELETVRTSIGEQMRTYNYMFAEADSEEARDDLMKQFIQQLFQIDIP
tara:strand:+ start:3208 stop:3891 length:684 start_codon:yes stop_codon:yes gene_type:complete